MHKIFLISVMKKYVYLKNCPEVCNERIVSTYEGTSFFKKRGLAFQGMCKIFFLPIISNIITLC